jgi:hypothetical protein
LNKIYRTKVEQIQAWLDRTSGSCGSVFSFSDLQNSVGVRETKVKKKKLFSKTENSVWVKYF